MGQKNGVERRLSLEPCTPIARTVNGSSARVFINLHLHWGWGGRDAGAAGDGAGIE